MMQDIENCQPIGSSLSKPSTTRPRTASSSSTNSLLAQALEIPSLSAATGQPQPPPQQQSSTSHRRQSSVDDTGFLPLHSDFTIPTSNAQLRQQQLLQQQNPFAMAPPMVIANHQLASNKKPAAAAANNDNDNNNADGRRSILGGQVGKRYALNHSSSSNLGSRKSGSSSTGKHHHKKKTPTNNHHHHHHHTTADSHSSPPTSPTRRIISTTHGLHATPVSPLTPAGPLFHHSSSNNENTTASSPQHLLGCESPEPRILLWNDHHDVVKGDRRHRSRKSHHSRHKNKKNNTFHETIHAQSFLLGIAFMAIWSQNNVMAPNLTQMATFLNMTESERDLYLGSYCALAVGVFSLPISGLIGFMADFYPRKHLFLFSVLGGSLAAAWTGWSKTFTSLFLARLAAGGCMSASVPVAFSLLGDLFSTEERNAASSGLTAMMGLGLVVGQVYAGTIGPILGWQHPFFASALLSLMTALMVMLWVREPDRGAKEKVLQDMLQAGNKYDRKLTLKSFMHTLQHNRSNRILLWQGFFTSLPWGIVFVFLNDYLSQEKGFSVPEATYMVMLFGIGCAIGGIGGGYIGQFCVTYERKYLPLFMAATTFLGTVPFLLLLNSTFPNHHGYKAMAYSILGGCIASLPSTNNRPCIINVNPPETRGAALTASNLLITLGRGIGPSCITLMGSLWQVSRQTSFNVTLTLFWTISAIQLLFLAKTLPLDQDAMEEELARYAASLSSQQAPNHHLGQQQQQQNIPLLGSHPTTPMSKASGGGDDHYHDGGGIETILMTPGMAKSRNHSSGSGGVLDDGGESLVSIEEYMTSFDGAAAKRSLMFMQQGIQELRDEITPHFHVCHGRNNNNGNGIEGIESDDSEEIDEDTIIDKEEMEKRRNLWKQLQKQELQQQNDGTTTTTSHEKQPPQKSSIATENTPLL